MERSLWSKLKRSIAAGMRQRITRSGLIFSFLISLVGAVAFLSGNNLLFLVLASLLAVLLVSGFVSRLSLAGLELDFVFPEHIPARRRIAARMRLRNEKSWMPSFSIHVSGEPGSVYSSAIYFPILPAGGTVEETVEVYFRRRGVHSEDSFELRSRFPFGFAERNVQVTMRREVVVYPCLDPPPEVEEFLSRVEGDLEAYTRGQGHDFYRIRPYEHQESARHVDWRATAHMGDLQVREFAQEQEPLVEIFFDINAPPGAHYWFEQAVDCAACISWRIHSTGARVRFRTQEVDLMVPATSDIYTILRYLALVGPKRFKTVLAPGRDDSLHLVFTANASKVVEAGWDRAHMFGLDAFTPLGTGAGPAD